MRKNRRKSYMYPKRGRSRYRKLMRHKREVRNSTARCWNFSNWDSLRLVYGNLCPDYWKVYWNDSTRKQEAKRMTNRAVRNRFKTDLCAIPDFEELPKAMKGAEYQKLFEYKWYVY